MPTPSAGLTRERMAQQILGRCKGKSVLVIGIGGGGDVVSTLPTCFDLERLGAREVIPAGLTWKRNVHDPIGRPRPLSLFRNVTRFNNLIGEANPDTAPVDSRPHVEAAVSRALSGRPIAMIDIAPGSIAVREALLDYQRQRSIDLVFGVDAGGDVLCFGDEAALESPICDQTMLAVLAEMQGALLGVFGFGSDGEMSLAEFYPRFARLVALSGFYGALPVLEQDVPVLAQVLEHAPTEASRLPMKVVEKLPSYRLAQIMQCLDPRDPDLHGAVGASHDIPMLDGRRIARLSDLSATTMFFDPAAVFTSSLFGPNWNGAHSIDEVAVILKSRGIRTEFSEKPA